jgi:hypothetical protein
MLLERASCSNDGSCVVNNVLTAVQVSVLHRSVFVK